MQEYTIQRSTRKCSHDHRAFEPNERYYSVVVQIGSELIRKDLGQDHWQGPPPDTIGWWVNQMPAKKNGKLTPAPASVLLDTLERLCESPDNAELAYVLALLLVRRRILAEVESDTESLPINEDDEPSSITLTHAADDRTLVVGVCQPSPDRAESLQQKLIELLYCDS
jgi:hypothetical protein